MHACGMQIQRRLGRQHTPIVEFPSADCLKLFFTLLLTSGRIDHTKFALLVTQHTWDEICSHFLQGFTCTRLPLSSTDCPAKTSRGCHLYEAPKPNLLAAWSQYAPTPAVHLQSPFVTLYWWTPWTPLANALVPVGFLQQTSTNKQARRIEQAGRIRRDTQTQRTQLLQSNRQSLATCSLQKHPSGTMIKSQCSDKSNSLLVGI